MTDFECAQIMSLLTAAYWSRGRPPADAMLQLYRQRLSDLDFEAARIAVLDFIDHDTKGHAPVIGLVREMTLEVMRENAKILRPERVLEGFSEFDQPRTNAQCKWVFDLLAARYAAGQRPGLPLIELGEPGGPERLMQECERYGIDSAHLARTAPWGKLATDTHGSWGSEGMGYPAHWKAEDKRKRDAEPQEASAG